MTSRATNTRFGTPAANYPEVGIGNRSVMYWLPIVDDQFIIVLITYCDVHYCIDQFIIVLITYCWWSVHYCIDYLLLMISSLLYWLPIVDDQFIIVLITYCWWSVHYCIDYLLLMISSLLYWLPIVDDQFIIVLITYCWWSVHYIVLITYDDPITYCWWSVHYCIDYLLMISSLLYWYLLLIQLIIVLITYCWWSVILLYWLPIVDDPRSRARLSLSEKWIFMSKLQALPELVRVWSGPGLNLVRVWTGPGLNWSGSELVRVSVVSSSSRRCF